MKRLIFVLLLLTACTSNVNDRTLGSGVSIELSGIDDVLYVQNDGSQFPQIGQISVILRNSGASATAGGLFVSGYDPSVIKIRSAEGQTQINNLKRSCTQYIDVPATGSYETPIFCDDSNQVDVGSIEYMNDWTNNAAIDVGGRNIDFFTINGLFTQTASRCSISDGLAGCLMTFTNPNFDSGRASHGTLLANIEYPFLSSCANDCRTFPERYSSGVLLQGVTSLYPQGDAGQFDYDIFTDNSQWNPSVSELEQQFTVTACYLYTSALMQTVCVDPNPKDNAQDSCSTSPIEITKTQSAPLRIKRITTETRSDTVAFNIDVEYTGTGHLSFPGSLDYCSPATPSRPDEKVIDSVALLDASINNIQLQCFGDSWSSEQGNPARQRIVRLVGGKGHITCTYQFTYPGSVRPKIAYPESLSLEFGYLASVSASKTLKVIRQ